MKIVVLTLAVLGHAVQDTDVSHDLSLSREKKASPVEQVVNLLTELKSNIEADGVAEQSSYDKYACWCEDTLAKKAQDITSAKDTLEDLQSRMVKLKGVLGSHGAEISQLKKDIAANAESQKEASAIREKETAGYEEEKTESEQCMGALEAAVTALKGAGTKKGFLETLQQARLLSVVAGVRGLLRQPVVEKSVGEQELKVVRHFVEHPGDFVASRGHSSMSAAQVSNPFGDYAPQSTQIQGILKTMYDSFAADLERANAEEAQKQKGFEELMATKQQERTTLQATLETHIIDKATKEKQLADGKVEMDDTQSQLAADEAFFSETKKSCAGKAAEWAQRTRMRTEELAGINHAVSILSSDEAKKTFENATTTFLQLAAVVANSDKVRVAAYAQLKRLAAQCNNLHIAEIAVKVKVGGHFDQIILTIENMIARLREEEQRDIEERDWCETKQGKNKNDIEDLNSAITKAGASVDRMENDVTALDAKISALGDDINTTKQNVEELKNMRVQEQAAFAQGVKDDTKAIDLLEVAIAHLAKYYDKSPVTSLSQQQGHADPGARPEVNWRGTYNKREGEGRGIVAILSMIKENLAREIKTARRAEADAQTNYESDRAALLETLRAQTKSQTAVEKAQADLGLKIASTKKFKKQRNEDLTVETEKQTALTTDCAWVQSHFQKRRDSRKTEINGLIDAKNYLAGVDSD